MDKHKQGGGLGCEGSPPSRSRPEPDCPICEDTGNVLHDTASGVPRFLACACYYDRPIPQQAVDPQPSIQERTQGIAKALEYAIRLEAEHAELVETLRDCLRDQLTGDLEAEARDLLNRIDNPAP